MPILCSILSFESFFVLDLAPLVAEVPPVRHDRRWEDCCLPAMRTIHSDLSAHDSCLLCDTFELLVFVLRLLNEATMAPDVEVPDSPLDHVGLVSFSHFNLLLTLFAQHGLPPSVEDEKHIPVCTGARYHRYGIRARLVKCQHPSRTATYMQS